MTLVTFSTGVLMTRSMLPSGAKRTICPE